MVSPKRNRKNYTKNLPENFFKVRESCFSLFRRFCLTAPEAHWLQWEFFFTLCAEAERRGTIFHTNLTGPAKHSYCKSIVRGRANALAGFLQLETQLLVENMCAENQSRRHVVGMCGTILIWISINEKFSNLFHDIYARVRHHYIDAAWYDVFEKNYFMCARV